MSEDTIEDTVDDTIEEKEAALRAALETRYEKEQRREFNRDTESNKNKTKTDSMLSRDFLKDITGIETDINEKYSSLTELQNSVKNVNKVRFELDSEEYTQWYQWHPDNKEHQLTCIVDYYNNGSISDLIGTEVSASEINGDYYINYPDPYNSRIAHIMYPIYKKLRLFNDTNNSNYAVVTGVDETKEISPSNSLGIFLSEKSSYRFGAFHSYSVIIGIISFFFIYSSFLLPLIALVSSIVTYWRINHKTAFLSGLTGGVPVSIFRLLKAIYEKIASSIKQLNRIDPIE